MLEIRDTLVKKCKVRRGDCITAGVSGGADSVCLLLLLDELRHELGFGLRAVHVHHGLRGAEADADAGFTEALCEERGIPFSLARVDAGAVARSEGLSVEEAARNARYDALRAQAGGGLIAVAHHADDQAETILMNIVRGTGLAGAAGMDYRNGDIIRPLLDVTREEIEEYLKVKGQAWRTDSTNADTDITRNKVRLSVMPLLSEVNARAGEHISAFGSDCREALAVIDDMARELLDAQEIYRDEVRFKAKALRDAGPAVASRAVLLAVAKVAGSSKDIGRVHTQQVTGLACGKTGRSVDLPYGITAKREYEIVSVRKNSGSISDRQMMDIGLLTMMNLQLLSAKPFSAKKDMQIPKKEYTKWFDYDKIQNGPEWRFRERGDVIELAGVGSKSVARYMIDEKIPQSKRNSFPLLADGSNIIWIPGHRISEAYKVTPETKRIIEINIEGECF